MPITFTAPELQTNEAFKTYETPDDLGKAFLDLNARVAGGDISLLPEELRKDDTFKPFKTLKDLGVSYVETKKMVGSIEKPPEKPDGYKWTAMANLDPDLKADGIVAQLKPLLHAAGAGNKMADTIQQGLLTTLSGLVAKQKADRKALSLTNETALRTEWGNEYDAKFDKIVKTMQLVGGPEFAQAPEAIVSALKGSPNFLKGMGKLVGLLSEDSLKSLGTIADAPITDPTAADAEITKFNAEINAAGTKHPYFNVKDAGHAAAVQKMHDLFALKNKAK
jgi:hypothetical protein